MALVKFLNKFNKYVSYNLDSLDTGIIGMNKKN